MNEPPRRSTAPRTAGAHRGGDGFPGAAGDAAPDTGTHEADRPVLLFDGVCSLCSRLVRRLIRLDVRGRLRFAALRSGAAARILAEHGVPDPTDLPDSLVLVDRGGVHVRSDAVLRIGRHLGGIHRIGGVARVLPRPLRDGLYDVVARNRHRWFGREDRCMVPPPGTADRFLDLADPPETP